MVDNIQLTNQQKLQQEKINAYITSLEEAVVAPGGDNVQLDENLHDTLAGVFNAFDTNNNGQFNTNETQSLVDHLKNLNSDTNIATMFDANGNLHLDTGGVDVDNNNDAGGQNDFVALDNILSSKAAEEHVDNTTTGKGQSITLDDGTEVNHKLGKDAVTFETKGGYHIVTDTNKGGHQTKIYDSEGKMLTHVSGDPHVNEGDSTDVKGWDWHFGDDSTFILDDGTEILFNTTGNEKSNVYVTRGLYIISDDDVYQTGLELSDEGPRNADITKLDMSAVEFDATHADAKLEENGADTFVYSKEANEGKGGWAVLTDEGSFEDIAFESWGDYRKGSKDGVSQTFDGQTVDTGSVVNDSINLEQKEAALDGEAVRIFDKLENVGATDAQKETFFDYYFEEGANDAVLGAYTSLVEMGGTEAQFEKLDEFIKNPPELAIELTDEQEANYLLYLITDEALGDMYLDLIEQTNSELDENGNPTELNAAKLELFENATLGENALNATQATNMLNYADEKGIEVAEAYVDLIQGGADADKIHTFECYLEKMGEGVDCDKMDEFVDALTEADETESQLLDRLVSDENNSISLLETTVDMVNNSDSVSIRESQSAVTNVLVEYAFGQEDLFRDVLEYQDSQLNTGEARDRQIISQNADLLQSLADAEDGRGAYGDILSERSQHKLGVMFEVLDGLGNSRMEELGNVLEVFNDSMVNGRASETREDFYKELFGDLLEINATGMSEEEFIAEVSESVFLSVQYGKENAPRTGIKYDEIQDLVSPYAESAQSEEFQEVTLDNNASNMLRQLRGKDEYSFVGLIAEAFSRGNEEFIGKFNDVAESNPDDIDKVAKETAKILIDTYEAMIDAERAKPRPSLGLIRTWERNVDKLASTVN